MYVSLGNFIGLEFEYITKITNILRPHKYL